MSIRQGQIISEYLAATGLPWNKAWEGRPAEFSPSQAEVPLPGGMRITLLSPRRAELQGLAKWWKQDLAKSGSAKEARRPSGFTAAEAEVDQRGDVLVIHARQDKKWAQLFAQSRSPIHAKRWVFWFDDEQTREANQEEDLIASIGNARVAVLLLSPVMLKSNFFRGVFPNLVKESRHLAPEYFSVLVSNLGSKDQPYFAAGTELLDRNVVLDELNTRTRKAEITRLARLLEQRANLDGKASHRPPAQDSAPINIEALANSKFAADKSVVNASSIAFLAEFHDRAVLVGGDAQAEVLCDSIATLLSRRKKKRLRLDAFVVPHAGSKRNLNRELLELLDCDRYLISTDGKLFNHPDRETIARIITYGRASSDRRPTLVFNYLTKVNEVWASPELQKRYRYVAVYPEPGTAGIKVQL